MSKLNIDMKALTQMAELLKDTGLTEIEWEEGDTKVRLAREQNTVYASAPVAAPAMVPSPAVSATPAAPAPADTSAAAAQDVSGTQVRSPMVGTVYLAPEPDAPTFVKVGDTVAAGQTIMIVEAMKTMNAVPSPAAGKVKAVLVENQQPVEFDQPLLVLE